MSLLIHIFLIIIFVVSEEKRKELAETNAPYFTVRLKDTDVLENTFIRFMVKVKGDPNPTVKFFINGKEIKDGSDSRITINRATSETGSYELIITEVKSRDAGEFVCTAKNKFGEAKTEATVTVCGKYGILFLIELFVKLL